MRQKARSCPQIFWQRFARSPALSEEEPHEINRVRPESADGASPRDASATWLGDMLSHDIPAAISAETRELGYLLHAAGRALAGDESPQTPEPRSPLPAEGQRVLLCGLREQSHLNGEAGVVGPPSPGLHQSGQRRVRVRLELDGRSVDVRTRNLQVQRPPARKGHVLLHSLRRRSDLNGQAGRVLEALPDQRCLVELHDGTHARVPNACTLALAERRDIRSTAPASSCCICLEDGRAMTAADPCGHAKVCRTCAASFSRGAPCPVCRAPVRKFIPLF